MYLVPSSFRWSVCLSFFGLYRLRILTAAGPLVFFQLHKPSSDVTLRHPTSECLPPKGSLVPGTDFMRDGLDHADCTGPTRQHELDHTRSAIDLP